MKELSLNVIDIAENSVKAKANLIHILISENSDELTVSITDDGIGMSEQTLRSVTDPFYTTRKTRSVGLGIPLLKLAAEQTGGSFSIESRDADTHPELHGTKVVALFFKNHLDFTPLGDIVSSIVTLIQGHPDIDFLFEHKKQKMLVRLDTRQLREVLEDVPLNNFEVLSWITKNLREQYESFD